MFGRSNRSDQPSQQSARTDGKYGMQAKPLPKPPSRREVRDAKRHVRSIRRGR